MRSINHSISKSIVLIVAYDGTRYFGWQKTTTGLSIEGELEKVLSQILQHTIILQAASRTDRGVHADNQVVQFYTDKDIALDIFHNSINRLLPKDIVVKNVLYAPNLTFHPTIDALEKEYHYRLCTGLYVLPHKRFTTWHYPYTLSIKKMRTACKYFIGTHDFSALKNERKGKTPESTLRTIYDIQIIEEDPSHILIKIIGKNFLYKMVRNIVGTLIYVGKDKLELHDIPSLFSSGDRKNMGVTAAALGLTLSHVTYQDLLI